ncbi:MAG: Mu transposase C-terminal domain-containing protein [Betaproteobacteria bacterium]
MPSDTAQMPLRLEIGPGVVAVCDQQLVVIESAPDAGNVAVRDLATGQRRTVRLAALRGQPSEPNADFDNRLDSMLDANDTRWQQAVADTELLSQLEVPRGEQRPRLVEAMRKCGRSRATIFRALARYRIAEEPSALLPLSRGPPMGSKRLDPAREALVAAVIRDLYLTQPRARVEDVFAAARMRCAVENLPSVSRNSIRARIAALDPQLVMRKRYGAKRARAVLGMVPGSFAVTGALSVVQIDHTPIDVHIVDSVHRRPIGRPWLSLAIDVATRAICGFHVSLDFPSQLSVALCVSHSVLPKDDWLAERDLRFEWPMAGLMHTLHSDNGPDLRAEGLERGCQEYGITPAFRPPLTPHFGGHIERLIGTIMGKVHLLPGTTYSNIQQRGDYKSEQKATMTLAELERWLAYEICCGYHQSVHRSLGITPARAWQTEANRSRSLGMPGDPRRFLLSFLPVERRTMQRSGLYVNNIRYWADVLPAVLKVKDKVNVRVDPRNLARIYVRGRDGKYIDVPYADLRHPPITLWEQKAAVAAMRDAGAQRIREAEMFRKVLAQRQILDDAAAKTRDARRAAERLRHSGDAGRAPPAARKSQVNWDVEPVPLPVETWEARR